MAPVDRCSSSGPSCGPPVARAHPVRQVVRAACRVPSPFIVPNPGGQELRRTAKAAIVLLGASLVAAACGGDNSKSSSTTAAPGTTAGGGANTSAGGATTQPAASGGTVTFALQDRFTGYNSGASATNLQANLVVTNQVVPSVSYFDNKGAVQTDSSLVDSVDKTSDNPLTVVYKFNPKAVWDDGSPIGCDDMYLYWVANNGTLKTTDSNGKSVTLFQTASTVGFDQTKSVECSPDGKTVTWTYASPFADWKAQVTNQGFVPAHVVAKAAGLGS